MPIWAYIYCGLIVLGNFLVIFDRQRLNRSYVVAGEALSGLSSILIFLLAYQLVIVENTALVSTTALVFCIGWSYHAHRHYLNYEKFKAEFHTSEKEDDEKDALIHKEEGLEYESEYNFQETEKMAHNWYIGVLVLTVVLALPFLYVYLK